ncbi:hypothetical protein [Halorussus caseinilyticus]|uniref:Prenyltransferase n=1 Tax=Halorussus caseinilyticus TaxID=3034025 RepID=A0ABD5WMN5_9EURY|nr:hypothetical protein [Halorussus sp. DT72]
MSYESNNNSDPTPEGFTYSLVHSLVSPYWQFNILEVSYMSMGMVLAAVNHDWSWQLWAIAMPFMWFAGEGANNLDLADEGMTVDIDSRVQYAVGYLMLGAAVVLGGVLSWMTSWWFFSFVVLGAFGAVAYNLELFDGRLHDREYVTGVGNLGFTAAWIPTVSGYFLLSPEFDVQLLGVSIFSFGLMLILMAIDYVTEDLKEQKYEAFDIEYTRDVDAKLERLQRRAAKQHPMHNYALLIMAVGLALMFL